MRRKVVIAVVGGGKASVPPDSPAYRDAREVGRLTAEAVGIPLCGGGSGVMEAAAAGAFCVNRHTIGVFKENSPQDRRPRDRDGKLGLLLHTGLGEARNVVNAEACDAMI